MVLSSWYPTDMEHWLIAGGHVVAVFLSSSRSDGTKLETPMALDEPAAFASSRALHVAATEAPPLQRGKWMSVRSTTSTSSCFRLEAMSAFASVYVPHGILVVR